MIFLGRISELVKAKESSEVSVIILYGKLGMTLYNLDDFLAGDIDEMIDALAIADRERMLSGEKD